MTALHGMICIPQLPGDSTMFGTLSWMLATRPHGLPKGPLMTGLFLFCLIPDTREQRTPTVPGNMLTCPKRTLISAHREQNSGTPLRTRMENESTAALQSTAANAPANRNVGQMRKVRNS